VSSARAVEGRGASAILKFELGAIFSKKNPDFQTKYRRSGESNEKNKLTD
jgi:hypothetical protein